MRWSHGKYRTNFDADNKDFEDGLSFIGIVLIGLFLTFVYLFFKEYAQTIKHFLTILMILISVGAVIYGLCKILWAWQGWRLKRRIKQIENTLKKRYNLFIEKKIIRKVEKIKIKWIRKIVLQNIKKRMF
jgi:hypothetical protein